MKVIFLIITMVFTFSTQSYAMESMESDTLLQFTAKVVYVPLERGFYGLVIEETEQKYLPLNLPESFQIDGLKVQVEAVEEKSVVGLHLWGKYIRIFYITTLEPKKKKIIWTQEREQDF